MKPPIRRFNYADFFFSGKIWMMWIVLVIGAALIENDGAGKWLGMFLVILNCLLISIRAVYNQKRRGG